MNAQFLPLLTFGVTHQYYGGGACPDFEFVLAEHSQRALAGARLLARMQAGRLQVMFGSDESNLPMQDIDGLELVIGLRLRNPYFEHFTDGLPEPLPLYANTATPKSLDAPQASDLVAHRITPDPWISGRPLTLSVRRMPGNALVWSDVIGDGEDMPTLDMRTWEPGCYQVTQQSATETKNRPLILAPDLAEAGMWGAVCIRISPSFWISSAPPDFLVEFQQRKEELSYFVVARNWSKDDFSHISVTDTAHPPAFTFNRIERNDFALNDISPPPLGVPDDQVVLFRSMLPIPRSSAAAQHFQLSRNGDTLIKSLPLPGADMPSASFVVHLSKP